MKKISLIVIVLFMSSDVFAIYDPVVDVDADKLDPVVAAVCVIISLMAVPLLIAGDMLWERIGPCIRKTKIL